MPIISGYQPAQNTLQQYVPLPFQEMMTAGQAVQGRADQTRATEDAFLDDLLKAKVLPGDVEALKKYSRDFQTVIDEANKGNISDPTVYQNIKSKIRSIATDQDFIDMQTNYAYHQQALKNLQKAKNSSNYGDDIPYDYLEGFNAYNANGGVKGGNVLGDNTFVNGVNINKDMKEYFNDIPKDGNESLVAMGNYYSKTGWSGISKDKIGTAAMNSFETFADGPGGSRLGHKYDIAVKEGQLDPNTMGKKEWMFNQFLATGLRRVGMEYTTNADQVYNHAYDKELERIEKQKDDYTAMSDPYESLNHSIVGGLSDMYKNTKADKVLNFSEGAAGRSTTVSNPELTRQQKDTKFYNSLDANQKKIIDNIRGVTASNPKGTLSMKEAVDYLDKVKDNKVSSVYQAFGKGPSEKVKYKIENNMGSYMFFNVGTGQMEEANDIYKKIDPKNKNAIVVRGQYNPDNWIPDILPDQDAADQFAQSYLVMINGNQYAVSQPLQERAGQQHFNAVIENKISSASRKGMPIDVPVGAKGNVHVKYNEGSGYTLTFNNKSVTYPTAQGAALEFENLIK